ncbi:MAG: DinB family protein [Ignavibacteria bacterium]|nr:DinB family protein [Ignavibacteria bacterium]
MNVLFNSVNKINSLTAAAPDRIKNLQTEDLEYKISPQKWSKKEILGHLCDSAVNNLSRFVRAQFEAEPFAIVSYAQDEWVSVNHYNEMDTVELLNYWVTLNKQIVRIISNMPESKLSVKIEPAIAAFREDTADKSLLWLIEDYVVHMDYHLKQIID